MVVVSPIAHSCPPFFLGFFDQPFPFFSFLGWFSLFFLSFHESLLVPAQCEQNFFSAFSSSVGSYFTHPP